MSLSAATLLRNLALGQAMLVAPALGDSYEAKSAGTISGLLLMIATDLEREAAQGSTFEAWLVALLSSAQPADPGLAAELVAIVRGLATMPPPERMPQLLAGLTRLHAFADDHDPALAACCREFLADWAGSQRIEPPAPPTAG